MYRLLYDDAQANQCYLLIETSLSLKSRIDSNTTSVLYELDNFVLAAYRDLLKPIHFNSIPAEKLFLNNADKQLQLWIQAFDNVNRFIKVKRLLEDKVELSVLAEHFFEVLRNLKIDDELSTQSFVDINGFIIWPPKNTSKKMAAWENFNQILYKLKEDFYQNCAERYIKRQAEVDLIAYQVSDYIDACNHARDKLHVFDLKLTVNQFPKFSSLAQIETLWSKFIKEIKNERTLSEVVGYLARKNYSVLEGYGIQIVFFIDTSLGFVAEEILGGCIYIWNSTVRKCGLEPTLKPIVMNSEPSLLTNDLKLKDILVGIYANSLFYINNKKGGVVPPYLGTVPKKRVYHDAFKMLKNSVPINHQGKFDEIGLLWSEIEYLNFKKILSTAVSSNDLIHISYIMHVLPFHDRSPFEFITRNMNRLEVIENPLGLYLRQWFSVIQILPSTYLDDLRQRILMSEAKQNIQYSQNIKIFCNAVFKYIEKPVPSLLYSYLDLDMPTVNRLQSWNTFIQILREEMQDQRKKCQKLNSRIYNFHETGR